MGAESLFLIRFGTKPFRLPASAIVGAAFSDLAVRMKKAALSATGIAPAAMTAAQAELQAQHYAFLGEHVRAARSVPHLLQLALDDDEEWRLSSKRSVWIIYPDKAVLQEALQLCAVAAA